MVQAQKPCTECQQDQGAHRGLQETPRDPLPHQFRRVTGGNHQLLPFPRTTGLRQSSVDPQHDTRSCTASLPPTVPREMQYKHTMAYELLPGHHREHSVAGGGKLWYGNTTAQDKKAIQRVIGTAENIIRCRKKPQLHHTGPQSPWAPTVLPLQSGRRFCSIQTRTSRFKNSFYLQAVRLLNC